MGCGASTTSPKTAYLEPPPGKPEPEPESAGDDDPETTHGLSGEEERLDAVASALAALDGGTSREGQTFKAVKSARGTKNKIDTSKLAPGSGMTSDVESGDNARIKRLSQRRSSAGLDAASAQETILASKTAAKAGAKLNADK